MKEFTYSMIMQFRHSVKNALSDEKLSELDYIIDSLGWYRYERGCLERSTYLCNVSLKDGTEFKDNKGQDVLFRYCTESDVFKTASEIEHPQASVEARLNRGKKVYSIPSELVKYIKH